MVELNSYVNKAGKEIHTLRLSNLKMSETIKVKMIYGTQRFLTKECTKGENKFNVHSTTVEFGGKSCYMSFYDKQAENLQATNAQAGDILEIKALPLELKSGKIVKILEFKVLEKADPNYSGDQPVAKPVDNLPEELNEKEKEVVTAIKTQIGKCDITRFIEICEHNDVGAERATEIHKLLGWSE